MAFKRNKTGKKKVPLLAITALIGGGLIWAFSRANKNTNEDNSTIEEEELQKYLEQQNEFVPGNEMEFSKVPDVINIPGRSSDDTEDDTGHIVDENGVGIRYSKTSDDTRMVYNEHGEIVPFDPNNPVVYDSAGNVRTKTTSRNAFGIPKQRIKL